MAHKYGLNTNYIDLITFLEIIYEDIPINKIPYILSRQQMKLAVQPLKNKI